MATDKEELERVRAMMKKKRGGSRDPNEWRPDKAEEGKTLKWKFFVLPPIEAMNGLWFYRHGAHFIENTRIECPRLHDEMQCPLCNYAFEVMRDIKDKDKRKEIRKALLPMGRYAINIYFPAFESTPVELRGKVYWFSLPETVYNICDEVIMRDGPGDDPQDPEPYGMFYDPAAAHLMILQARKQGDYNTYESSSFVKDKRPITQKEGMVEKILEMRHDVPSKFDARDMDVLQRIVNNLKGEPDTEAPKPKPQAAKSAPAAKPTPAKPIAKPTPKPAVQEEVAAEPEGEVEAEPAPKPTPKPTPKPAAKPTTKPTSAPAKTAAKPAPKVEAEVEVEAESGEVEAETEVEPEAVAEPAAAEAEGEGEAAGVPDDDPELAALLQKLKNE